MYWEPELETMPREELRRLQLERINRSIQSARRAPHYGGALARVEELGSLEELARLPFTEKADLRAAFPYGFLAVGLEKTVRLHSSSGTTGNPTVVYHTRRDIERWSNLIARSMFATGVRPGDVFQNMMGYGLFTGGLGFHYGAERLGVLTIPIGPGNSRRQVWFLRNLAVTVVHILPSYALRLAGLFGELEVEPKRDLRLRIALIGAEPHSEGIRRKIEDLFGIKAYNSYGLSEMCGPGVAFECPEQQGLHLWEDQFYPEIVDPATGEPVPEGQTGELVLTTLEREAMPLVRYRTRDLTRFLPGPCPCGRTHRRIDRIQGRSDDMLIINGVNMFPIQIEKTLMGIPEIGTNYLIEVRKENFMDRLEVRVEVRESVFRGTLRELERLQGKVCSELRAEIGVTPTVHLVEPSSLPVSEGKAQRVYDFRKEG
jgi:phenylacetate-CoA ligase